MDSTDFHYTLVIRPHLPSLLTGPLDCMQRPHRTDECKSLENVSYELVPVFPAVASMYSTSYLDGLWDEK